RVRGGAFEPVWTPLPSLAFHGWLTPDSGSPCPCRPRPMVLQLRPRRSHVLELRLLHYFVAVAETEHVGRAAERLHVSQSPLSRQVRQLEGLLGLRLFDRERQRVKLTDEGRWLLGQAREVIARAERMERDAARLAQGEVGRVTV